jgi:hypothetical protein
MSNKLTRLASSVCVVGVILLLAIPIQAKDIYVAQTAQGSDTGADATNAHSAVWFNNSGNWGGGTTQINPGDTVHLIGGITSTLAVQAGGTVGNVTTIYFESGAKLTQPASTLMRCENVSYVVIDGGANGVIENTDNGTALGHQIATSGVYASGSSNLEIKNLTIRNLYVHTSTADNGPDVTTDGAIYFNGMGNNVSIHDNTFSDVGWVINLQGATAGTIGLAIYNNSFTNYDHGIAGMGGIAGASIHHNHFGSTANWDTTSNRWHHDGIHIFFGAAVTAGNVTIHSNLFDGDWGTNNTAHIFMEGDYTHTNPATDLSNITLYNNVFIQNPGNLLNNGFVAGHGASHAFYNNTLFGSGVTNSAAVFFRGTNLSFKNNVVSGVTTFLYNNSSALTFATGGLDSNLYANQISGGNSMFFLDNTSYSTLSAWQTATGQDAKSALVADAHLNGNGTLQGASAAVGAGVDLSILFGTDKNGCRRQGNWDLGAYILGTIAPPSKLHISP